MTTHKGPDRKVETLRRSIVVGFGVLLLAVLGYGLWYSLSGSTVSSSSLVEGEHYVVVGEGNGRLTVTEYFSYGCVHCYTFEDLLEPWAEDLPDDVSFTRSPVAFSPQWNTYVRIYYAAEVLGVLDDVHMKVFRNIHERGNPLTDPAAIAEIFVAAGVPEEEARRAIQRPVVGRALRGAELRQREFQVRSTPSLVVADKYLIEVGNVGRAASLDIAEALLERERAAASQSGS